MEEKFNINELNQREKIFPHPSLGINSRRNSIGEEISEKNKPKITVTRLQKWCNTDWHGNSHQGVNPRTYKKYPTVFMPPQELKIIISKSNDNRVVLIVDDSFKNTENEYSDIKFAVNLLLEIFRNFWRSTDVPIR